MDEGIRRKKVIALLTVDQVVGMAGVTGYTLRKADQADFADDR